MPNTVSWIFVARDKYTRISNQIGASTVALRKKFAALSKQLVQSSFSFKNKVVSKFRSGFAQMAAAAAGFFGARAFLTQGVQFQDALADLSAITGVTGDNLQALQTDIFSLGKDAAVSGGEVAEAFKLVASAKPDLLENIDALKNTTKEVLLLKNAAGIDLAEAANTVAQGLNIFGEEASQANRFVNVLAAGAKLGSSEIRDTSAAMLIAGPAARAAGLSFEQLNAAIQTTALGGIKAEKAGTALNAILGRLRRTGFNVQELGLEGTFSLISEQLNKITDSTARAQAEAKLFGEEHTKVGLALINNFTQLGKFEKSLTGTNIAQEQADIRLNTFSSRMRKFGTILSEKFINLFLRVEPILAKNVDRLGQWFDSIQPDRIESFSTQLETVLQLATKIGEAFGFVARTIDAVGVFIGETAAQIANLDFDARNLTSFGAGANQGGPALITREDLARQGRLTGKFDTVGRSTTDVNVNLNAPEGVIDSVKSKTTGNTPGLNLGVNMAPAL